jgi:stage II sporulation protein AA (anti-sigma F factor antagonist)
MAEQHTAGTERAEQPGGLTVAVAVIDGIRVLTPAGEIDHHTGDTLRQALKTVGAVRPRMVIDLHQVPFMDSTGVNILINAHQAITAAGGRLRLAALTQPVLRLLQIVGVDAVLSLHPTLEDALAPPPAA